MKKIKNVCGERISENLIVLNIKKEKNHIYYYCECLLCGNEKWLRSDVAKKSKSCGCLKTKTQFKIENLEGKKFGRLLVTNEYKMENNTTYWLCKCECGKKKWIAASSLKRNLTKSCGCLSSELASKRGEKLGEQLFESYKEKNIIEHSNIAIISRTTVNKNNTSGVTGVCFDKTKNKWVAKLTFQGETYHLGTFSDKQDAIKARKEAEEKYFVPFLKKHQ